MASKAKQQNATPATPDMSALFEQFAAFVQQQQATPDTPAPASKGRRTPKPKGTPAAKLNADRKPKGTTPTRKTPAGVITCGDAWKLLGADPQYMPSNPTAPARNAQLWALNAKGLLRVTA